MAIERYAGMDDRGQSSAEEPMPDESMSDQGEEAPMEDVTARLPMAILGGQDINKGDVLRVEVVEKDEPNDEIIVKYASENPAAEPAKKMGMEGMAAEFD